MNLDTIITIEAPKIKPFRKSKPINIEQTGEILEDKTSRGRVRPWDKKRIGSSELVADALSQMPGHERLSERCENCATVLIFAECENEHRRLRTANFCHVRVCPMCEWRRSLKLSVAVVHTISHAYEADQKLRFVYLVFTQKNVQGEDLESELGRITSAWSKLRKRKEFEIVKGWIRTIEITRNLKNKTWHPHLNVIIAVPPSYFSHDYVKQSRWRELWQEVMGLDYLPQVNVQAVKMVPSEGGEAPSPKAALELAKYCVKDADLMGKTVEETRERLEVLVPALHHKRLIDSAGCLKMSKDPEAGDLVHIEGEDTLEKHVKTCPICSTPLADHLFRWIGSARRYVG